MLADSFFLFLAFIPIFFLFKAYLQSKQNKDLINVIIGIIVVCMLFLAMLKDWFSLHEQKIWYLQLVFAFIAISLIFVYKRRWRVCLSILFIGVISLITFLLRGA